MQSVIIQNGHFSHMESDNDIHVALAKNAIQVPLIYHEEARDILIDHSSYIASLVRYTLHRKKIKKSAHGKQDIAVDSRARTRIMFRFILYISLCSSYYLVVLLCHISHTVRNDIRSHM